MSGITQYNAWYNHLGSLGENERLAWVNKIIAAIEQRAELEKDSKLLDFAKLLKDTSKCKVVGLQPYIEYTRVRGNRESLEPNFLHAWGSPAMVVVLKGLPGVMVVGSDIKWSDSVGFTG